MFEAPDGFSAHTDYLHKSFGRHGLVPTSEKQGGLWPTGVLTFVFRLRLYLQQLPTPFPGPELTKEDRLRLADVRAFPQLLQPPR